MTSSWPRVVLLLLLRASCGPAASADFTIATEAFWSRGMYLFTLFRPDRLACVRHNRRSRQKRHFLARLCASVLLVMLELLAACRSIDTIKGALYLCQTHRVLRLAAARKSACLHSRVGLTRQVPDPALCEMAIYSTACSGWPPTALSGCVAPSCSCAAAWRRQLTD